ncbi:MAG: 3-phosphoshikimate 1-carboxyvinyltransferase [Acidobacteria bacterium]|nr:3-phosphoshikimate 1-carboxyvinyltransferase [Acidobacteriota bacterium]
MQYRVKPASGLQGVVRLPGDKSISHRYAMIAAVAEGDSKIENYSSGADCQSTLRCLRRLGIGIDKQDRTVTIHGRGLDGFRAPAEMLDAGNSGSTIRMLSGMLAAQPFTSSITGDESLVKRPMARIMKPLALMGATVTARDGQYPPLEIQGGKLIAIQYEPPVASAQVKTCVLFAGLHTAGVTSVVERVVTRDHTEVALREFGAEIEKSGPVISIVGRPALKAQNLVVPGDLSSAAFFLVAANLFPGSRVAIEGVGLSPSRTQLIDWLMMAGAQIRVLDVAQGAGEMVGSILVDGRALDGGVIEGAMAAGLIDEIPVLAVLGAVSRRGLTVRDAKELRVKETDRIATLAENMQRMGIEISVSADGFHIPGGQSFRAATLDSFGDHRIAMAFAVAGLRAEGGGETVIDNADAASVSFPEFYDTLESLRG